MTKFNVNEIAALRVMLAPPALSMEHLTALYSAHTRDEIVEAIDAIRRYPIDWMALHRVNQVLRLQAAGIPLVNGLPA